jgi:mannose-6-phosphate isomerase-like protein (cupin superfamily)
MMRSLLPALLLVLVAVPPAAAQVAAIQDMQKLLAEHPLGDALSRTDEIARTEGASVHLVQTRTEVPLNFHQAHDELVFLWSGSGKLEIAGTWRDVKPGEWVLIPRRTTHAFKAEGGAPAVALSIFTPAFDGKDRVLQPPDRDPTPKPKINDLIEKYVDAYRKPDIEMLAALQRVPVTSTATGPQFDPEASARLKAEVEATRRQPCRAWGLDAIASFPYIDHVPPGTDAIDLEIESATGPLAFVVALHIVLRTGDWVVGAFALEPLSEDAKRLCEDVESGDADPAELELRMFPRGTFGRADPTDLRAIVQAHSGLAAVGEAMPSVRGFWRGARRARLEWQGPGAARTSLGFLKGPEGWAAAE